MATAGHSQVATHASTAMGKARVAGRAIESRISLRIGQLRYFSSNVEIIDRKCAITRILNNSIEIYYIIPKNKFFYLKQQK